MLKFRARQGWAMGRFERLEFDAGIPRKERKEPTPIYDDDYYIAEGDRCFYRADYEGALLNYSRALRFNNDCERAWVGQVKALIELGELRRLLYGATEVFKGSKTPHRFWLARDEPSLGKVISKRHGLC